jgi:GT2 family glycosyltransferase
MCNRSYGANAGGAAHATLPRGEAVAQPVVSIIVPTLARPEPLRDCLRSIEATVAMPHETIVVAVKEDEPTHAVLREFGHGPGGGPRVVLQPERGGFVQAANRGFRAARGVFVTQINDDCTLLPHTIANAVRFLEAPSHRLTVGQAAFFYSSPARRNIFAQVQLDEDWFVVAHVRGLCYANFGLVRRALGEQLGWYDERYFMYGADPDFSLKVWHEAKLAVVPCPGALVRHRQLDDSRAAAERARQGQDNARLFAKWKLA